MKSLITGFIFILCMGCFKLEGKPVLQAYIQTHPHNSPTIEQVQPGSFIHLKTTVKNVGNKPNKEGSLVVRFVFPPPLDTHKKSLLFETETLNLPSLKPNEEITLEFETLHRWPTLFDYVREDWAMREYQALVAIDDKKEVIGTRAIAFTAYYYPGHRRETPKKVPAL